MSRNLLSLRNVNHRFIGFLPKVRLYRLMAATDSVWSLQWLALLKSSTLYFDKTSMIFLKSTFSMVRTLDFLIPPFPGTKD